MTANAAPPRKARRTEPQPGPQSDGSARFRLYVIELGTYPSADGRTAIYVGSTRLSRRQRWREHCTGAYTASRRVTKYGTRRLPELARGTGTYPTRDSAEQAEHRLRLVLEGLGYRVFGGSGRPMPRRPRRVAVVDASRKDRHEGDS